jgi:peptide chain release factor subunit 1
VPVIDEDTVRELAAVRFPSAPVTSCYLDVDGSRFISHQDYEQHFAQIVRSARVGLNGDHSRSVEDDLLRFERHVKGGFDRSGVKGLAMFSCSAEGWWQVVPLPVPVRDQIVVNRSPYVSQLEWIVQRYERFGVLLADRQRARLFVFELGQLVDRSELFDQLPRHDDDGGEWDKDHVQDHVDALAAAHIRHAAAVALHEFQEHGFDHLILGGPDESVARLQAALHPYLAQRVVARISAPVGAADSEIHHLALSVEEEVEIRKEADAVRRLRDAVGVGKRGAVGLDAVLELLAEKRVDTLLASRGFMIAGWHCELCGRLARMGPRCPTCAGEMARVADVVEEAIEEALGQSCRVVICGSSADLDVLGRIGAILRF